MFGCLFIWRPIVYLSSIIQSKSMSVVKENVLFDVETFLHLIHSSNLS